MNPSPDVHGLAAFDRAIPSVRSDANRELRHLLQEVRAGAGAGASPPVRALLLRAIHCAVQHARLQAELGSLALTDDLTGLYNRRGFLAIGEPQLRLARRSGRGLRLFVFDVDGLKRINDTWGHCEGDRSLARTAELLGMTFRASDVRARLGGDEFAVLAVEDSDHTQDTITRRLHEHLLQLNTKETRYCLSLSWGVARFSACSGSSVTELIRRADEAMYAVKHRRTRSEAARAPTEHPRSTHEEPATPRLDGGQR